MVSQISDSLGDTPSSLANALGIKSSYTQTGAFVSEVIKSGNIDLGYHYNFDTDARTSLAEIKIAAGQIFIFGSPLLNREIDVAWDISQIIGSGFIDADVQKINSRKLSVPGGDKEEISRQINIGNDSNLRLIVFSTNLAKRYFLTKDFKRE